MRCEGRSEEVLGEVRRGVGECVEVRKSVLRCGGSEERCGGGEERCGEVCWDVGEGERKCGGEVCER